MFKKHNLFLPCCLLFPVSVLFTLPLPAQKKFVFRQPEMGSPFILTLYGPEGEAGRVTAAAAATFRRIDTLNLLFSDYLDSSELNRLSRKSGSGRYIPVSKPLLDILQRSVAASQLSGGSFDITVGPVVKLWRKARRDSLFPATAALREALQRVGYRYIHIDTARQAVLLEKEGMQLDLGGIAKGYAAQAALDFLRQAGYPVAMIDAGGDLAAGDPPPGGGGWRIGVNVPEETARLLPQLLLLRNRAVATSGDVYQYLEFDGRRYSHIINPQTGLGVTFRRNVTVVAADGATADWLASACSILPRRKAFRLIRSFPQAALLIAEWRHGKIRLHRSPRFKNYLEKPPAGK